MFSKNFDKGLELFNQYRLDQEDGAERGLGAVEGFWSSDMLAHGRVSRSRIDGM